MNMMTTRPTTARHAVDQYNEAVKVRVEARDEGSKVLFERMIQDEERHVDFLEAQLHSIKEMAIANYLTVVGRRMMATTFA